MANQFNTIQNSGVITKLAAQILADKLHFMRNTQEAESDEFKGKNGFKAGITVQINKPARYIAQNTFDITGNLQDTVEEKAPLTLDIISTVGLEIDSLEYATELELEDMMTRVIEPAMNTVAHDVESQMMNKAAKLVANQVGTAGSTVFDPDTVLSGREKLNKYLTPTGKDRSFQFDATAGRSAVKERAGLFHSSERIAEQYDSGLVGIADGFKWLESELLYQHLNGTDVTGVAIDTAVQASTEGQTSIGVDGLTATTGTVTAGTVFTVASVFAVHPITKAQYPFLQQFTATALATADGGGLATIQISPTMFAASAGLQNISALPADTAALVFSGAASTTFTQNLQYHKQAFHTISVPLIMPKKAEFAEMSEVDGVRIAIIRDFDVKTRSIKLSCRHPICYKKPI